MAVTSLWITGKPVPASRPKVTRFGTYYPKAHTERSEFLRVYLQTLEECPVSTPVEVRILNVMPRYATSDHPVHRADVDNLAKLPLDVMTKSLREDGSHRYWKDDDLIVSLLSLKRFCREGEEAHTEIKIIPINGSVEDRVDALFGAEA